MTIGEIARVCHEVNAAYCRAIGDMSQPSWEDAPEWQKESAMSGVVSHVENPELTPEQSHRLWMAVKSQAGWAWGPVKNAELKQHPCMMSYHDLPQDQKVKDYLFKEVVRILTKEDL